MRKLLFSIILLPLLLASCVDSVKSIGQSISEAVGEYDNDPEPSPGETTGDDEESYGSAPADYQGQYDIAVERARQIWIATATGDVQTLRQFTTGDFFDTQYRGYSDDELRDILLSVPYDRRQKMIDHIKNHCSVEVYPNSAGDVVSVVFTNEITGKPMTFQLVDETGDQDWKLFEYYKD